MHCAKDRKMQSFGMQPILPFSSTCSEPLPRDPPLEIALAPRAWLSRKECECAFPVDGASWATRSCCNPCGSNVYCLAHLTIMRVPRKGAW